MAIWIPEQLKKARTEMGLTQMEMASRLGVEKGSVSNWERGVNGPDGSKLADLCKLTGKPAGYFYRGRKI